MTEGFRHSVWFWRGLFVAVWGGLLFLRLLPFGTLAGGLPGPDLLLCLVLAWTMRRPEYLPPLLIAAVMLADDLFLMRPPGLWAALVVIAAEFVRSRVALTRELAFLAEWALVAGLMFGLLIAYRLAFTLSFVPQPDFGYAVVQMVWSIVCYPAVVGLSLLALDLRKPARGEIDARGRRM